jgi:hypothetical protein
MRNCFQDSGHFFCQPVIHKLFPVPSDSFSITLP